MREKELIKITVGSSCWWTYCQQAPAGCSDSRKHKLLNRSRLIFTPPSLLNPQPSQLPPAGARGAGRVQRYPTPPRGGGFGYLAPGSSFPKSALHPRSTSPGSFQTLRNLALQVMCLSFSLIKKKNKPTQTSLSVSEVTSLRLVALPRELWCCQAQGDTY